MTIFLGNLIKISDTKWKVGLQHNMPFDNKNGMKDNSGNLMTEEQLNQMGILVDSIPEPVIPTGKQVNGMFIDPTTKNITYEYTDIQKTDSEKIVELQKSLLEAQNAINSLLGV